MAEIEIGACIQVYCNTCKGLTHHELQATHTRYDESAFSKDIDERFAAQLDFLMIGLYCEDNPILEFAQRLRCRDVIFRRSLSLK